MKGLTLLLGLASIAFLSRLLLDMRSNTRPRRFVQIVQLAGLVTVVFLLNWSLWLLHSSPKARTSAGTLSNLDPNPQVFSPAKHSSREEAVRLSPRDLMSRPLSADRTRVPKLLHQSWKNATLPAKFEAWSKSCRTVNSDWEYVLWTDDDNAFMVEKYAPWFLDSFNALPEPIERADASRNLYMHIFGGVYADLDTECLRPVSERCFCSVLCPQSVISFLREHPPRTALNHHQSA